ncbi:HNH endonuclease [Acinetobacter towneri]|uniref:HNH endonuclease n=1 Tax=Acinetobacter towneri TaxID=202956 RepID=UPI0025778540|nr:HNH endonuclease signature motif containing protein [Acinetobacter towneri]MDM1283979.1 HNH endonuclease [Acinetobacter towneri]
MKNLKNNLSSNSIDFMRMVVSSMRNTAEDQTRKTRLLSLITKVDPTYSNYDSKFSTNTLPLLTKLIISASEKSDLLSLYSYKNSKLTAFRRAISTDTSSTYQATCQYCTVNSVNSLDHFVPKDLFPEFSVHPSNLVPSCTECNSKKLVRWLNNNQHLFLNLYIDLLPNKQYLFVELNVISLNKVDVNFKVDNPNNIPVQLYTIITSHYTELDLFQRFKDKSSDIIIELTNSIQSSLSNGVSLPMIQQIILDTCSRDKQHKGYNYYQIILKEALIQSSDYLSLF